MKGAMTKSFCLHPCTQYQGTEYSWREDDRIAANVINVARRQALHQTLYIRNLMQLAIRLWARNSYYPHFTEVAVKDREGKWRARNYKGSRARIWNQALTPQNPDHFWVVYSTYNSPSLFKYIIIQLVIADLTDVNLGVHPNWVSPSLLNLTFLKVATPTRTWVTSLGHLHWKPLTWPRTVTHSETLSVWAGTSAATWAHPKARKS